MAPRLAEDGNGIRMKSEDGSEEKTVIEKQGKSKIKTEGTTDKQSRKAQDKVEKI